MIAHLAEKLVDRYASAATHILDPFCGSGAVLTAGARVGARVTGFDVNPFGVLLTRVKVQGFYAAKARDLCEELIRRSKQCPELSVDWSNKTVWFTPATLRKFERLRWAAREMGLWKSMAGRAVLLAMGLAVRRCSRSDQRSPKPFISKYARENRSGRHFDPEPTIRTLLSELARRYGVVQANGGKVHQLDLSRPIAVADVARCSHVITSPPYINAQDYFRNFKLELYLLEGVLPFDVCDIMYRFIGTERGVGQELLHDREADDRRRLVPEVRAIEDGNPKQGAIVHRYIRDMAIAFRSIRRLVQRDGTIVLVCGDNLIGGHRICTWRVLNQMLTDLGFVRFDSFGDRIRNRAVAPMRCGHKGIIKEEIVTAFRLQSSA